jgi:hypothetical protein
MNYSARYNSHQIREQRNPNNNPPDKKDRFENGEPESRRGRELDPGQLFRSYPWA